MNLHCKLMDDGLTVVTVVDDPATFDPATHGGGIVLPYTGPLELLDLLGKPLPNGAVDLEAVKAALKAQVDTQAETLRTAMVTPGAGQAMEYQEAQAQAEQALALPKASPPKAGDFPMLDATIGIDLDPQTGKVATDALGVARGVKAAKDAWVAAGAFIRNARLAGKAAIAAASDVAGAMAAHDAIVWDLHAEAATAK